jgi:hypothetical protein
MKKTRSRNKIYRFFKLVYIKLFRIDDTPQKIALGFGLGVFLGVFPGTGLLASLVLAWFLRLNRAAALLGSLLTNTWFSFLAFILAVKTGSVVMGVDWQKVYQESISLLKGFNWLNLFKLSILKVILPVIIGYLVIGLCLGFLAYLVTLPIILKLRKKKKQGRPEK